MCKFSNTKWFQSFLGCVSLWQALSSVGWGVPNTQQGFLLTTKCRRACLARWSLRMKRLKHSGQANLFSPVWVRRCRESSSERAKRLSQPSHLHLKGFSPGGRTHERRFKQSNQRFLFHLNGTFRFDTEGWCQSFGGRCWAMSLQPQSISLY